MVNIGRDRSEFWVQTYALDDGGVNLVTSETAYQLLQWFFPSLEEFGPRGWRETKAGHPILWIPGDRVPFADLEDVMDWANAANSCIWLGTNKYTRDIFEGVEADYCVAADWNFLFDGSGIRTQVGEAEYQLKYRAEFLTDAEVNDYADILVNAILGCASFLPLRAGNFIVTAVPAAKGGQKKLAWLLAQAVATELGVPFLPMALTSGKKQMKNLPVAEKAVRWGEILSSRAWLPLTPKMYGLVRGGDILIVDDLYQSGTSVWCLAKFLKDEMEANMVAAATAVKSQRDGDNQ